VIAVWETDMAAAPAAAAAQADGAVK
jgi:hypothetical protein